MKKVIVFSALLALALASCKSDQTSKTTKPATKEKAVLPNTSGDEDDLDGTWELISTISEQTPFNTLYPNQKPTITFNSRPRQISGTTGCNTYTGSYTLLGSTISFGTGLTLTKMACDGKGEAVFVERLNKATDYFIKDQTTLMLMQGDVALLEFKKTLGGKSY
jgi:heat shock protein HslJ